jgi:adenylate cyclase
VNLGSRLEGLNKVYGTEILLSETTAELAQESFRFREMDLVRVKGRKQPVRIYELVENSEAQLPKEKEQALSEFAAGLEAYRQQFWEEARGLFKQSMALWPEDGASRIMAERCEIYQETPPPEEWDGVFEMKTK